MEKYKRLLFEKIKNQIADWFDSEVELMISNEEVYRFLHSIKGTSGTLDLRGLYQVSTRLLESIEDRGKSDWDKKTLRDFLYEIISLAYQYEHFNDASAPLPRGDSDTEHVPLIQVIDDDLSMLILLKDALESKGWMVIAHTDPDKAVAQSYDLQADCFIVDINLEGRDGLEFLERMQRNAQYQLVPKIMISVDNSRETRMKAYKLGADDFIEKPIDMEELIVRVGRQLQRKQYVDNLALVDELTKVYNRRFLSNQLERSIQEFRRTRLPFSIAILDIDWFKKINDTFGHPAGDRVLVDLAHFLKEQSRTSDVVFRYGGEEFVILFPKTTESEAVAVLSRLLQGFSSLIFEEMDETFSATFSAGVIAVTSASQESADLLRAADQALYEAKESGKSRIVSANKINPESRKKLYVSVIDDDAIIRAMLVKILQGMDMGKFTLDIAAYEDGKTFFASGRLEGDGEHFLILDGIMPVMDGLEVLQKVKQTKDSAHVLMLTGRKSEYDISRALKLGADDYMTKPFSIKELEARIQRLIKRMF
ncbi:diguanylate cyclase [Mesobacillus foraminis]|uniref:diguanylate cyclase n=1 Tax=Mesobacillus foraminis TaxID=279826 RepID=UPI00399F09E3